MSRPLAPTGLTTAAYANLIIIKWRASTSPDVKGYNIYNTQTSGGGISGYTKLNDELIQIVSSTASEVVSYQQEVVESGGVRTTTLTENLEIVSYFSYTHLNLQENKQQFYVLTAVNTNGEESLYSNEIFDTPIIINTAFTTVPQRNKSDIKVAYFDDIFQHNTQIDVKPGTLTTDIFVDPATIEFNNAYILIDFFQKSSSFASLKIFDDSDGNRLSDSVTDSIPKQNLRTALGYNPDGTEDYLVQYFIDSAFDRLAANAFVLRLGATKAQGQATFYTTTLPANDITINAGEVISTSSSQNAAPVNFKTLSTLLFIVKNSESYYNKIHQRYEMKVAIECLEAGIVGNKTANTIVNTKVSSFKVTNEFSTFDGKQQESNADLADRAILAYGPLDVGTVNGYERTVIGTYNVDDVMIVDAGDTLMMRDYDDVRGKHVFGKVDIYFQGQEFEEQTENIGFLYDEIQDEPFTILQLNTSLTNLKIESTNTLTATKPIFEVSQIRNVTQGFDYDVLGNVMIYVNGTPQTKGRFKDVEVDLTTGEVIFLQALSSGQTVVATYDAHVIDEVTLASAVGGETSVTLAKSPTNSIGIGIREESYFIYKTVNDVTTLLVESVDYTIDLLTGIVTFALQLGVGEKITSTYAFINTETFTSSAGQRTLNLTYIPIYPSISYNLNQIEINRFNIIKSTLITYLTPTTDIIYATYRYRNSSPVVLVNQPVESISSITGSTSGLLEENIHYIFDRKDDILLYGNSTQANRGFTITYANGLPSGSKTHYVENILLSGTEDVSLTYKGVDINSILVQNTTRTATYSKNIDYVITDSGLSEYVKIHRLNGGAVSNGQTILVDYYYGEVLTVKYLVNNLVKKLQDKIDIEKHITADVLVKASPITKVDINVSVVLHTLADKSLTKNAIISKISDEIVNKKMGDDLFRSDIIRAIDSTDGVDYVILPMTRMAKADGTMIVREKVETNQITWVQIPLSNSWITSLKWIKENPVSNGTWVITPLHSNIVNVSGTVLNVTTTQTYTVLSFTTTTITLSGTTPPQLTDILELNYYTRIGALEYPTTGSEANPTLPFGIFKNDVALTMVPESEVDNVFNQGVVLSDGALIISDSTDPNGASITVTYFIEGQTGDNDINVSSIEHLEIGSIDVFVS